VNFYWFDVLPLQFLYLEQVFQSLYCGFYVGIYAIISSHSNDEDRAFKLARMDALLTIVMIVGYSLAYPTFEALSYYGTYAVNTGSIVVAILYTQFVVKEHPDGNYIVKEKRSKVKKKSKRKTFGSKLYAVFVQPVVDFSETVTKKRPGNNRKLVNLLFISMALFYMTINEFQLMYQFMKLKYDVDYEEYSLFNIVSSSMNLISLTVLMPIMVYVLKLHEATIMTLCTSVGAVACIFASVSKNLFPGFILTYGLANIRYCCSPTARSLLTKMVDKEEIGKIFAVVSLIQTLTGIFGVIAYRKLYEYTLETFSSSFMLLSSALFGLAGIIGLYLISQRKHLKRNEEPEKIVPMQILGDKDAGTAKF
jgi:hypothetical protein